MLIVESNEMYTLVGEVEFHIILARIQNSFCTIALCDKVFKSGKDFKSGDSS